VEKRKVSDVVIYGHSHGGGATYELATLIGNYYQNGGYAFEIAMTGYIDAIRRPGVAAEDRRPNSAPPYGSKFHVNYYQSTGVHGVYIAEGVLENLTYNIEVNQDVNWNDLNGDNLTHTTIDDSKELHSHFRSLLNVKAER
jgi:hypothetical protein